MNKFTFLLLFIFIVFFHSCTQSSEKDQTLPVARGGFGEIIVIMDSTNWRGELGEALRDIFLKPIPGLPQEEAMYSLHYVNPLDLNDVLRNAKNMIFVTTMEGNSPADKKLRSYFTRESMEKIQNDPDLYMYTKQDEFAKGQEILHLFGKNKEILLSNIRENATQVQSYFDAVESKRLKKSLYAQEEKGIQEALEEQHGFSIRVPFGYQIAKNEDNFVWLRQLGRETDKSIFITYRNYDSEGLFSKENILNLREEVARKYIFDADKKDLYVTTQRIAPVDTTVVNFNGHYAVETRGLWKLTDNSLGGPFISYTLADEESNRLYYIEGYGSSPGNDKRGLIKELEVVLSTFKP